MLRLSGLWSIAKSGSRQCRKHVPRGGIQVQIQQPIERARSDIDLNSICAGRPRDQRQIGCRMDDS
jgi:hypothetical protein